MNSISKKITPFQMILLSFAGVILLGAIILTLPFASADGCSASFSDALFTAVSAVCVTGLVVRDTATEWSVFGQAVILLLIQIGGLGVISAVSAILMLSGKKINIAQRNTMQEAIAAPQLGGITKVIRFIFLFTFGTELVGCLLLMPVFCRDFEFGKGLWYSFFHSISAFCNAGFDLMGINGKFSSLTSYSSNILLNIVIMLMIISGGLGFFTWNDILTNRFRFRKYRLQSKIILVTTAVLIVFPAAYLFFFEYGDEPIRERLLYSLFQSVTTRTAGFNTADFGALSQGGLFLMMMVMLIGGSTGSTAGGIKTNTIAVLVSSTLSVFRRREDTVFFGRRIDESTVNKAAALLFIYLLLFAAGGISISLIEELPLLGCLFESASAVGTVGLSLGLTPTLSLASRIILMCLMFFGRVGGLTFIYAAISPVHTDNTKYPMENINVG
ncbi:MAG: TrkH family potassium uptake protein [Huintestinicola sp.]